MKKPLILGLSASLRRARSRGGAKVLVDEIGALDDREALDEYLASQAKIHLEQFVDSGRGEGLPFDVLYRRLQTLGGLKGLSNSEVGLVAALWGGQEEGANIEYAALADYFPANGDTVNIEELKSKIIESEGIILATPVYFGDRSSIAHRLIELMRTDEELRRAARGKFFAGVAIGAKRNGGQETTLIYQMLDMLQVGYLAVGNDSETTSQYGGTGHAGDIGTMPGDTYGINTCIGTGRRIARVARVKSLGDDYTLSDKPNVQLWMLQDRAAEMRDRLVPMMDEFGDDARVAVVDLLDWKIRPCIACDVCPTHNAPDDEYRCIIGRKDDGLKQHHLELIDADIVIPAMYSPVDRDGLTSVYQQFVERTRYLRRGDYVFTDRVVAPVVFAEVGSNEHLDVRMATSFIRHHTVICRPVVGWIHEGKLINEGEVREGLRTAIEHGAKLLTGRLGASSEIPPLTHYQPVGYVLAVARDKEPDTIAARDSAMAVRRERLRHQAQSRLETKRQGLAAG